MSQRKVRNHTAVSRSPEKKDAYLERNFLPRRPQTSLGFDRDLSPASRLNLDDRRGRNDKVANDLKSGVSSSKRGISPLSIVLERFTRHEEHWEKLRSLPLNPSKISYLNEKRRQSNRRNPQTFKKSTLQKTPKAKTVKKDTCIVQNRHITKAWSITKDKSSLKKKEDFQIIKDQSLIHSSEKAVLHAKPPSTYRSDFDGLLAPNFLQAVVEVEDNERFIKEDEDDSIQPLSKSISLVSIEEDGIKDESLDYDTELEEDFPAPPAKEYDASGRQIYIDACLGQGVIPVSYVVKRLANKQIVMRHHGLGPQGTQPLAHALMKNTCIEQLDLTDNDLQTDGGIFISLMLYENFYITDLNLSENFLYTDGGTSIAKVLLTNTSLKRLILQSNHLTDKVAKAFAEVLKENRTLVELDLSFNEIGELGGLYLGAGLALNYGLKNLNLSWNGIRNKGAVSIAAALKSNDSLKVLNLGWNGLAFVGALAFTRHLKKNETLIDLDLSNNRISPKGAVRLSTAVAVNTCLQVFKIGLNPIGDEGVQGILNAAKRNLNIKFLGLEDITVSPRIHDEIILLENSRDITILTGGKTGHTQERPPPSGMEILVQFIQDNRLRLKDLFFQFDKDQSGDISRDEFKAGLKETGIQMSEKQLDALICSIDIDNSNTIEYSEILYGREAIMKERRFQRKVAIRTEQREKESIKLPKLKGFEE